MYKIFNFVCILISGEFTCTENILQHARSIQPSIDSPLPTQSITNVNNFSNFILLQELKSEMDMLCSKLTENNISVLCRENSEKIETDSGGDIILTCPNKYRSLQNCKVEEPHSCNTVQSLNIQTECSTFQNHETEKIRHDLENYRQVNASLLDTIKYLNEQETLLLNKIDESYRALTEQQILNKELTQKIDSLYDKLETRKGFYLGNIAELLKSNSQKIIHLREVMFRQLEFGLENQIASELKPLIVQNHELNKSLKDKENFLHFLRENQNEIQAKISDKERSIFSLKRNLDDATLQMSKAVLDRTKFMNERDHFEKQCQALKEKYNLLLIESSELHSKLAKLGHENAQLHNKLVFSEKHKSQETQNITCRIISAHTSNYLDVNDDPQRTTTKLSDIDHCTEPRNNDQNTSNSFCNPISCLQGDEGLGIILLLVIKEFYMNGRE